MAIFGVQYRLGLISSSWKNELYAVMGQTLRDMDGIRPIIIGGVKDHVHVLFSTKGNVAESEVVRKLKSESSLWVNSHRLTQGQFAWQRGGARISYSHSALPDVKRYIANQEDHHRRVSFREEYERLLANMGAEYSAFDLPEELK